MLEYECLVMSVSGHQPSDLSAIGVLMQTQSQRHRRLSMRWRMHSLPLPPAFDRWPRQTAGRGLRRLCIHTVKHPAWT